MGGSQRDREMELARIRSKARVLAPAIRELFDIMDADSSGKITVDDITTFGQDFPEQLHAVVKVDNLINLFEILGVDGDGAIEHDEFMNGLLKLTLSDTPIETIELLRIVKYTRRKLVDM